MSASGEVEPVCKAYTSFKVFWEIENFCLAVRPNIFKVETAPFLFVDKKRRSSWLMRLEMMQPAGQSGYVEFSLERKHYDVPEDAKINLSFEVTVFAGGKTIMSKHVKKGLEGNMSVGERLGSVAEIVQNLTHFEPDSVSIECHIAFPLNERPVIPYSPSYGLKQLSEDLMNLKKLGKLSDATVTVSDKVINVHKAILARNQKFGRLLQNKEPNVDLSPFVDYKAVSEFLNLMYSGDVDHVYKYHSVHMLKCLEFFNCDILRYYRGLEELSLRNKFNAEPHEFHWVIRSFNLKQVGDVIESPIVKRLNVNIKWKLKITVSEETISIFAEIVEGDKPKYYILEFGVKDSKKQTSFSKRLLGNNENYDDMGFEDFVKKADLDKMLIDDGDLYIVFGVRTSDGTNERAVVRRSVSIASPCAEPAYESLSLGMRRVLKLEKFYDVELKIEEKTFKAHKCVLLARSTAFAIAFNDMPPSADSKAPAPIRVIRVPKIKSDLFEKILEYIYSGVLKTGEKKLLIELYVAAERLGIASLQKESYEKLRVHDIDMKATDAKNIAEAVGGKELAKVIKDLRSLALDSKS